MTERAVIFEPFAKQQEFVSAFLSGNYGEMLYGGAIRGGKSYLGMALVLLLARLYPGSRWAIMRANLPRIRQNVLPTFNKLRPEPFCSEVNKSSWTAQCSNGSEILFVSESIKDDPELNKMRGFEVNGFLLEEANEMSLKTFHAAQERAGTWIVPGAKVQPPALIMATCNPGQSWVKDEFYDPSLAGKLPPGRYFLQANANDNPYVTDEQKERWKSLPEHLYRRYVLGDWTVTDDPMQVVPYEDLYARLVDPEDVPALLAAEKGEEALGVDYAGHVDLTALAHMRGALLYEIATMRGKTQGEVAAMVRVLMSERAIAANRIGIDAVGEGSGVWGNLKDAGVNAQRLMAGGGPWSVGRSETDKAYELVYRNLKTQMWWKLRQDLLAPEADIRIINDHALVQDLLSTRYRDAGERMIELESKDSVKKRIGRSPDRGDAAVMANFVRGVVEIEPFESMARGPEEAGNETLGNIWSTTLWQ